MKRSAYSGPVRSSPNSWMPKPLWMHCSSIPPRNGSRSTSATEQPASRRLMAAASPALPPPTTTASTRRLDACPGAPADGLPAPDPAHHQLAPRPVLCDLLQGHARFPADDLHDPVSAEAALAPSHAGARVVLDPVQRRVAFADGLHDLRLGDRLAAAHDVRIRGVLLDETDNLRGRPVAGAFDARDGLRPRGLFPQRKAVFPQDILDEPGNGRGRGKAGDWMPATCTK